jgi:hypothetical protein
VTRVLIFKGASASPGQWSDDVVADAVIGRNAAPVGSPPHGYAATREAALAAFAKSWRRE